MYYTTMLNRSDIDDVRQSSRKIVRKLGFLEPTLAKTGLSSSAVHALIEIGAGARTANELSEILLLEKSTVSRMVKKLIAADLLETSPSEEDGRQINLGFTPSGRKMLGHINNFGRSQVQGAFEKLSKDECDQVRLGLKLYANALGGSDNARALQQPAPAHFDISRGHRPALLGQVTSMHARYYSANYGFSSVFEIKVAAEMGEFLTRIDHSSNEVWSVVRDGKILGSISMDGQDLGHGKAHLRWFIMDDAARGIGAGKQLLSTAMQFAAHQGFSEVHLWTFKGLDAARCLYEQEGFSLRHEELGNQWGTEVYEQHFVKKLS